MNTLGIELGERSYPIHIGSGLLDRPDVFEPHVGGRRVLVVTNELVGPLYAERLARGLAGSDVRIHSLPDGERHKTLATLASILDLLVDARFARDSVVVALGGGVVGDVAGFAAACFQRGIDYVQVPTTLLAQVDSAVGGKTAVNHPGGKNLIGAFHQPVAVMSDIDTLATLPARELRAGFAEIVKYGIVADAEFFEWLESNMDAVLALDPDAVGYAIRRSCEHKAALVAADEREAGVRALLNLGHTFGHAIETGLGYGEWLHGEAVAAGTCLAADLSARLGWLDRGDAGRIEALLARAGLPVRAPASLDAARLLDLMAVDKKVLRGRVRLVLLEALGRGVVTDAFDPEALTATLECCREAA